MSKPKRMILCDFPNNRCNLKCEYCYITQIPDWGRIQEKGKYSVEHIAKCLSAERLGGPCLINMTGTGETMLEKDIVKLCQLLLEQGHYIEFVTNLTMTKVVEQFLKLPASLQKHMEFKISFHYNELKRLHLLDNFFENVDKIQKSDFSFALELMPYDALNKEIDQIYDLCMEKVGAPCQVTVGRRQENKDEVGLLTDSSENEFKKRWLKFDSKMFDFKMGLFDVKRKEFCYAGAWTLRVNLYSGEASPCYAQPYKENIFDDPSKPIKFIPVGCHCAMPFCINGHAHMSLGVIPEYEAPTFEQIRNRTREDGREWFSADCKEFFSGKLYDTNEQFSAGKKLYYNLTWYLRAAGFALKYPNKIVRRIKLHFYKFIE